MIGPIPTATRHWASSEFRSAQRQCRL